MQYNTRGKEQETFRSSVFPTQHIASDDEPGLVARNVDNKNTWMQSFLFLASEINFPVQCCNFVKDIAVCVGHLLFEIPVRDTYIIMILVVGNYNLFSG